MSAKTGIKGNVSGVGLPVRVIDRFLAKYYKDSINISAGGSWGEYCRVLTETNRQTNEEVLTDNARPALCIMSNGKRIRGMFQSATAPAGAVMSIAIFEVNEINDLIAGLTPDFTTIGIAFPMFFDYTITSKVGVVALQYLTPPPSAITDGILTVLGQIDN